METEKDRDMEMLVIRNDTLGGAYERTVDLRGAQEPRDWFHGVKEYSTLGEYVERLKSLEDLSETLPDVFIARYQALAPIMEKGEYPIVVVQTDDSLFQDLLVSEGFLTLGDAILSSRGFESGSYDS